MRVKGFWAYGDLGLGVVEIPRTLHCEFRVFWDGQAQAGLGFRASKALYVRQACTPCPLDFNPVLLDLPTTLNSGPFLTKYRPLAPCNLNEGTRRVLAIMLLRTLDQTPWSPKLHTS